MNQALEKNEMLRSWSPLSWYCW